MENCQTCQSSKAKLQCGICKEAVCKSCAQFMDEEQFSFLAQVPENLKHTCFCPTCYNQEVAPAISEYETAMAQAKETMVFFKKQSKETRLIKRLEDPVNVVDIKDYDEAILRLAFFASQKNYNSIIDVELSSKKIKSGSYNTTVWSATGIPAHVKEDKLLKDRSLTRNPN